jgi:DNA repair protein RadA/Sms
MAKAQAQYQCRECACIQPKWSGQCPDCRSWNSIEELPALAGVRKPVFNWPGSDGSAGVIDLDAVPTTSTPRFSSEIEELDRVLGGGLVQGSVVLLGGDPGIGKSTLLLQCLMKVSRQLNALYVTGEESLQQVSMRAQRLSLGNKQLKLLASTCLE